MILPIPVWSDLKDQVIFKQLLEQTQNQTYEKISQQFLKETEKYKKELKYKKQYIKQNQQDKVSIKHVINADIDTIQKNIILFHSLTMSLLTTNQKISNIEEEYDILLNTRIENLLKAIEIKHYESLKKILKPTFHKTHQEKRNMTNEEMTTLKNLFYKEEDKIKNIFDNIIPSETLSNSLTRTVETIVTNTIEEERLKHTQNTRNYNNK